MKKYYSNIIKKIPYFVLLLAIIYLSIVLISYNSPNKVDSELSGIFIDYDSAMRGVSVDGIHIDSIDEVIPNSNSTYWFGCTFNNYSPPIYLEVYFPFNFEITSYGGCRRPIDVSNSQFSVGDEKCYSFDARVVDGNILQIIYTDNETYYEQLKLSANIFSSETPDRYVFKSFQIKDNPLPFTKSGKLVFQNNNIDYSIKIRRNNYRIDSFESNFNPEIKNELTGDFNYQRIYWESKNTPGENILYISDNEETKFKNKLNLFGALLLGLFLGIIFERIMKWID